MISAGGKESQSKSPFSEGEKEENGTFCDILYVAFISEASASHESAIIHGIPPIRRFHEA
jgi:hypothetical protein